MDPVVLVALIGLVTTTIGVLGTVYVQKRKTNAEAGGVIVGAATDTVKLVREQMAELAEKNKEVTEALREANLKIESLKLEVAELRALLRSEEALRQRIHDLESDLAACKATNIELKAQIREERDRLEGILQNMMNDDSGEI